MSVINQMLRDLDKQQGKIPSPPVAQPVFARPARGAGWRWLIPLCLLVLLGLQWQPQLVTSAWSWLRGVMMSDTAAPVVVLPIAVGAAVTEANSNIENSGNVNNSNANSSQSPPEVLTTAAEPQSQTDFQPPLATIPALVAAPTVTAASPVEPERAPKPSAQSAVLVASSQQPELAGSALQPSAAPAAASSSSSLTIAAEVPDETPATGLASAAEATTSFEPESWTEPLAKPVVMAPSQLQIEQLPDQPDLQLTLLQQRAQQAAAQQQLLQAAALWQQYQQLAPERALAYEQLAQLWWQQQQWAQLAQVLAQAQSRQIQSTTLALQQARLAASQQQWSQVLTALAQWPAAAPLTEVLPLRAQAQQQLGDFPAALASYQQLVQLQPDSARAWLGQALVYDQLQQTQAAIASYRQALALGGLAPASQQFIQQRLAQTE
jgi:tetratricopeptide (TPR) repeat protein